jgi:hypothetical protein
MLLEPGELHHIAGTNPAGSHAHAPAQQEGRPEKPARSSTMPMRSGDEAAPVLQLSFAGAEARERLGLEAGRAGRASGRAGRGASARARGLGAAGVGRRGDVQSL